MKKAEKTERIFFHYTAESKTIPAFIENGRCYVQIEKKVLKLGKYLKEIYPYLTHDQVTKLVESYKAEALSISFEIIDSGDIPSIYSDWQLSGSCMSGEPEEYFEIYSDNCRGMIVAKKGKVIVARALLWDVYFPSLGEHVFCDRIYAAEPAIEKAFISFVEKKGFVRKAHQNYHNKTNFFFCGSSFEDKIKVELSVPAGDYEHLPYLDTLSFAGESGQYLYNTPRKGGYTLDSTEGAPLGGSKYQCVECGGEFDEEDGMMDENGEFYCSECGVFVERYGDVYARSQCVRVGDNWEIEAECVLLEDTGENVPIEEGEWCSCDNCGRAFSPDGVHFDEETEECYCEDCYEDLKEEREKEVEKWTLAGQHLKTLADMSDTGKKQVSYISNNTFCATNGFVVLYVVVPQQYISDFIAGLGYDRYNLNTFTPNGDKPTMYYCDLVKKLLKEAEPIENYKKAVFAAKDTTITEDFMRIFSKSIKAFEPDFQSLNGYGHIGAEHIAFIVSVVFNNEQLTADQIKAEMAIFM